uniref:Saposin B-type domain-containing protein n=1 Tax=Pyramimonas obovata TaxID=1411642 RepID=A0A7S0RAB8_9CHLO|mmetsp:Transcript_29547/g.64510  ORF Transcript_29547/g.64510 Transcript_29547/m.64510 type:complete len:216 (+) Transcript_29547:125-772(+)|eukprot:CAMPEP_0118921558 /NCGR_PEP_ID=MMETSP1169-20130426/793_1 /TAXON_ID=36882 /ORGANISM="Pyramimonas obovata, Strain CCMP722" /LENGTH=215 /DNA_ID=CAMNT_0006862301 /DNA_START=98 /DNA_END=745 /DNA_ORIENTATION=+
MAALGTKLRFLICTVVVLGKEVVKGQPGHEFDPNDLPDDVKATMPEIFPEFAANAMGAPIPGITREQHCEGCKIVMSEVNKQLNIKETRTFREADAYMNEMCEDIEGWHPPHIGQVCRTLVPKHTLTIRGLIQMTPGNLETAVCAHLMKVCPEPENPLQAKLKKDKEEAEEKKKKKKGKKSKKRGKGDAASAGELEEDEKGAAGSGDDEESRDEL